MSLSRNNTHKKNKSTDRKAILLIGREQVGGAEKRFGRAFINISRKDTSIFLIINQTLYESLIKHGIPLDKSKNIFLIKGTHYANISFVQLILSGLSLYPVVSKIIRDNNIKLVHSMGYLFLTNFLVFLRTKNVYKGISIFDSRFERTISNIFLKYLFKAIIKRADFIDFLSHDIRDKFSKEYGGIYTGKYYVSPCSFIDYSLCNPNGVTKKNNIIFMARLIKDKNPFLLLDAVPVILDQLAQKNNDTKIYLVGAGPLSSSLKIHAKKLGIDKHTVFIHTYAPERLLCESKIFVSLQEINNYPSQSLIEAMACENAVVATDVGETWKLVNETTGIRVKACPADIAGAIVGLLNNPAKLKMLGKNAREKVLREHTIERFVDYLLFSVYCG